MLAALHKNNASVTAADSAHGLSARELEHLEALRVVLEDKTLFHQSVVLPEHMQAVYGSSVCWCLSVCVCVGLCVGWLVDWSVG